MRIPNVSFKSIMVFTLDDKKSKQSVPDFLKTTFKTKQSLNKRYKLVCPTEDEFKKNPNDKYNQYPYKYEGEAIDAMIYNANTDFARKLDELHKERLSKNPNEVILTEAEFLTSPAQIEKRYFLTAANGKEEDFIQKVYTKVKRNPYFFAKFYQKD